MDESELPQKVTAAKAANQLPDVIELGIALVSGYAEQGLLDTNATTETINELDKNTFYAGPLELVKNPKGEGYAAVPIDGFVQGIWYRTDWFQEKGLPEPKTWDDIMNAAKIFNNPSQNEYGIVIGTDPEQVYTQQVFEQFALSNGARAFDQDGKVILNNPKMVESLDYYTNLSKYGPSGNNYWREARQYYITGKVAMIFYSTYIIDDIAGLVEEYKPTVPDLSKNTGFVPIIQGPIGNQATYGEIYTLGIMKGAEKNASKTWIKFLLNEGYLDWVNMAPGGKIPVRKTIIDEWKKHEYFTYYEAGLPENIASGMEKIQRWGYLEGKSFPLITQIYGKKIVPNAIGKILAGDMTPEQATEWIEAQVKALEV
ncbi:MAG: ABC transporter substrate-binding protein [Methanosarcinales archaeon]